MKRPDRGAASSKLEELYRGRKKEEVDRSKLEDRADGNQLGSYPEASGPRRVGVKLRQASRSLGASPGHLANT